MPNLPGFTKARSIFHLAALGNALVEVIPLGFLDPGRLASRDLGRMRLDSHCPTVFASSALIANTGWAVGKYVIRARAINVLKLFTNFAMGTIFLLLRGFTRPFEKIRSAADGI